MRRSNQANWALVPFTLILGTLFSLPAFGAEIQMNGDQGLRPDTGFECPSPGYFPDPVYCDTFHYCLSTTGGLQDYWRLCQTGQNYCGGEECGDPKDCPCNNPPLPEYPCEDAKAIPSRADEFKCTEGGEFPDPVDCTAYHHCVDMGGGRILQYDYNCPAGKNYCAAEEWCGIPERCPCCLD